MDGQVGPELLDLGRALVVAGDDRDLVPPGDPAGDLAVQVRAGPAPLRVGPVPVGEQQDVERGRGTQRRARVPPRSHGTRPIAWLRCGTDARSPPPASSARLCADRGRARRRPRAGRGRRRPVPGPVRRLGLRRGRLVHQRLQLRLAAPAAARARAPTAQRPRTAAAARRAAPAPELGNEQRHQLDEQRRARGAGAGRGDHGDALRAAPHRLRRSRRRAAGHRPGGRRRRAAAALASPMPAAPEIFRQRQPRGHRGDRGRPGARPARRRDRAAVRRRRRGQDDVRAGRDARARPSAAA